MWGLRDTKKTQWLSLVIFTFWVLTFPMGSGFWWEEKKKHRRKGKGGETKHITFVFEGKVTNLLKEAAVVPLHYFWSSREMWCLLQISSQWFQKLWAGYTTMESINQRQPCKRSSVSWCRSFIPCLFILETPGLLELRLTLESGLMRQSLPFMKKLAEESCRPSMNNSLPESLHIYLQMIFVLTGAEEL